MKNSIPIVAGLIGITMSLLTGCSSTPNPPPSSSSHAQSSTESSSVQTPTTALRQTTSSAARPTSANAGVATCQTRRLSLTQGRLDGTAGSSYVTYYLQNHGPSTCSMAGYPGFSLLFANGSIIQRPATRNGTAYTPVRLQPGQRAHFVVRTVDGSIPGTGCSTSWKTAEVQAYPPNQTTPIRQPSAIAACDLTVGPVSTA
jgi:hypothetical protein